MAIKVAINGFGRIGRLAYRAMVEQGLVGSAIDVVAVGDIVPADNLAYLVKYDSTQGTFPGEVTHEGDDTLIVNGEPSFSFIAPALPNTSLPTFGVVGSLVFKNSWGRSTQAGYSVVIRRPWRWN